ncbi:MAG: hypothetical protein WD552_01315 [Candidatus Paceibacterota bacterium]
MGAITLFVLGSVLQFIYPADPSSRTEIIDFVSFFAANGPLVEWLVGGIVAIAVLFPIGWTTVRSFKYKYPDRRFYPTIGHEILIIAYLGSVFVAASSKTLFTVSGMQDIAIMFYIFIPGLVICFYLLYKEG